MKLKFSKMEGLGNDFIILDDRDGKIRKKFWKLLKKNLVIVGIGKTANSLTEVIEQNPFTTYNILGYVSVCEILEYKGHEIIDETL